MHLSTASYCVLRLHSTQCFTQYSVVPEAIRELDDAVHWHENQRQGLGGKFLAEVDEGIHRIVFWTESAETIRGSLPEDIRACIAYANQYVHKKEVYPASSPIAD